MPQVDHIEQHSEEVQDIMGRIPGSLTRWGLMVIFLVFFMIIAGSYFFKFKEIVSAPMIITTANPPAPLICKASGRIARWFVTDGQKVKEGDYIALIQNSTALEDLVLVEKIILKLDSSNIRGQVRQVILPEKLILGELQETYNQFCRNWKNYRDYLENNFLTGKIELLGQEMEKQEQYYHLALEQKKMMEQELALAEKGLQRHQSMLAKGGISESQLEVAQSGVIQSKRSYSAFMASLKSTEISLLSQKRSLLEMQEQDHTNVEQYELNIAGNLRSLKNQVKAWKDNYLLNSPIEGTVTLTRFWSENHVVISGERLATIVPTDNKGVICRAKVPSSGIGRVEKGQKVNIKLSGFPYMEHGILTGEVSAVSLVPEENSYMVEIRVNDKMQSTYREQLRLVQEMEGTADIITRENRLMIRFIKPLKVLFERRE
ncbi:MAG: HlyD family secretion protein [Mangrovibacterium sp.]